MINNAKTPSLFFIAVITAEIVSKVAVKKIKAFDPDSLEERKLANNFMSDQCCDLLS
jgi:hypothetical protein